MSLRMQVLWDVENFSATYPLAMALRVALLVVHDDLVELAARHHLARASAGAPPDHAVVRGHKHGTVPLHSDAHRPAQLVEAIREVLTESGIRLPCE